jgi:hypothetical protein
MGGHGEIQGEGQGDLTQPGNATMLRGVLNCSGIPGNAHPAFQALGRTAYSHIITGSAE